MTASYVRVSLQNSKILQKEKTMDKSAKAKCSASDKIATRTYKDDERKKDSIISVSLGLKNARRTKPSAPQVTKMQPELTRMMKKTSL